MTRLTLAMLSARRGAALTVFVLAVIATAAAAAGPLYRGAATHAATSAEVSAAEPGEQVIRTSTVLQRQGSERSVSEELNQQPPHRLGFDTVFGVSVVGRMSTPATVRPMSMVFRSGACRRLIAVTGRCVSGANEVMLSAASAAELGLAPGAALSFQPDPGGGEILLTLVGTYRPRDARDPYWAGRLFGRATRDSVESTNAAFVTKETIANTPFVVATTAVDLMAQRATFDDPARLRAEVLAEMAHNGSRQVVNSDIPQLLERIDASSDALADGVGLAAVPLVLLCWFVLYLAVASGAFRRRGEFGLTGLRGVPRYTRWWLSTVEYLVPLFAGGVAGYLAAYLLGVALAGRLLPGDPPVQLTAGSIGYAGVAVGGAVAVGLLAQRRAGAAPVTTLLRRVPTRQPVARLGAVDVAVVVLALAAGYQVRTGAPAGGGVALLTPMLVALAVGLVAARLIGMVADRIGRRALRRGRLGRALAGLYLARQPSQARLLGVLVTMFGVLGFAVTAAEVGATVATARIRTELGAERVVGIERVPASHLLSAVRDADPEGRYAMAVARLDGADEPLLAVDATRLARVAIWAPSNGVTAADVARRIEPQEPAEIRLTGTAAVLRLTVAAVPAGTGLRAVLLSPTGGQVTVGFGVLRPGPGSYRADTPGCARRGCRLVRLVPVLPSLPEYDIDLTVHELRQYGPDRIVAGPAEFARVDRWAPGGGEAATVVGVPVADGYRVRYSGRFGLSALMYPVGTPRPIPVASTGPLPSTLDAGGQPVPVTRAATPHLVPGLGPVGGLVSLWYADLAARDPSRLVESEVWLTSDAPAGLLDRLRDAGLVILSDRTVADGIDLLDRRGPALALRFYLMVALASAALGVGGLAVVAVADRWAQAGQLRALRRHGLSPTVAWRVGFGGYGALIAVGLVLGAAAAAVAWWLARTVVPFFTDAGGGPYLPAWPAPAPVVGALVGATVLLLGGAAVAAVGLRRAVERTES